MNDLMTKKRKLERKCSAWKGKAKQTESSKVDCVIDEQWLKIKELENENKALQEIIDSNEKNELQRFADGKFSDKMRQVVMKLHELKLNTRGIAPAIQIIAEELCGMRPDRLPSYGTVNKIMYEAEFFALVNAGKSCLRDIDEKEISNILLNDGTTKLKKKYNTTIVSTSECVKTIGLQHLAQETGESLLKANQDSLAKLANVLSRVGGKSEEHYLKDLLISIKGTMSDRCEVMKKFNRIFNEFRSKRLIDIGLSADEENLVTDLEHHFCLLHVIINLGEDACKRGLIDLDKCTLGEDTYIPLHRKGNSTTYNAILLAARICHQQGSETYGKSDLFEAFLDSNVSSSGIDNVDLDGASRKNTQTMAKQSDFEKEVGNRAHITFHNGAALWKHRNDLKNFLDIIRAKQNAGETARALADLLGLKVPLAGARALGIIKACITGPFQAAFDKTCSNILDMVPYCIQMKAALGEYAKDATDLLTKPQSVFQNIPIQLSPSLLPLFDDTNDPELDALTILAMQLLLRNHQILFERQCEMYIAGGEHADGSKDRNKVRNCPLTNRASESNMGFLDREVRIRPNATPGYLDASLIVRKNTTSLDGMCEEEMETVFKEARQWADEEIRHNKELLKEHMLARKTILEQNQMAKKEQEVRSVVRRSKLVAEQQIW